MNGKNSRVLPGTPADGKLYPQVREGGARQQDGGRVCNAAATERGLCRMMMETSPAYFVAIDAEGRTLRMNTSMLDALGYASEEVEGKDYLATFVPKDDQQQLTDVFATLVRDKQPTTSENRVLTRDGKQLHVEWHGNPVLNKDGGLECFFGVGIDVTDRMRAEDELRAQEEKARRYLDLAGVMFLGLDTEGRVSSVNEKGCEILGGDEDEILGLDYVETFSPAHFRQREREIFRHVLAGEAPGESFDFESQIITLKGERRTVESHSSVERDEDGNIIGTLSSGIDITERKRAEDVQRLAYRIGSAVHTAGDMKELFDRIREALGEVMNTENFFIALYDRERDTLSLSYFIDKHDQDDFDSFPAGKTLTGYIIKHDTSLLITRETLDEWTASGIVDMVGTPSLVWLGVPLRVSGEVIGALVIQSYEDRSEFGEPDKEILEFVSEQIGFAIEHKRAENELVESEARNRAILDAVPDLMFRISRNGTFLSYDAPQDAPLALPPEMFIGKRLHDVLPAQVVERTMNNVELVFRTKRMQLMEYSLPVPYPDGELREFEARLAQSGEDAVLTVVRDITDRSRAEKFLRTLNEAALTMEQKLAPEEVFTTAAELLSEVGMVATILMIDDAGDTLSPAHCAHDPEMLHRADKLLGEPYCSMPCVIDEVDAFRAVAREGKTVLVDNMVEFLRQRLPLPKKKFAAGLQSVMGASRAIVAPMVTKDAVFGLLCVNSDDLSDRDVPAVTAFANQLSAAWRKARLMKELELSIEELRETQDQLLQAQKMEAVGRLAGGVAHDFNNLLTAISGYSELLSGDSSLGDRARGDVEQIRKAAEQAAALTSQLLAFSRRQPLQPVVVDLNKIVIDMDAMLRRLIGEDIELVTTLDEELRCQTKVDPGQLEQVIINLAVNARDAMPEGGRLTISTGNVVLDSASCAYIHDARPGQFVCLSIEDTGSGIERDVIDQIFEPFFSTKGPTKGTGLGLAVVYGIIRQHGGWINVYSEPNQGTAFKVYLPSIASTLSTQAAKGTSTNVQNASGSGQRILLVEDEEAVRELASRALKENGYVVFEAGAYEEALDVFQQEDGKFDLIFSDVVLPDKSGIRLIDDLLQMRPDLQVLVCSGYTDQKSQWPIIQEKGLKFLQKPYSLVDLLGTVDELVL